MSEVPLCARAFIRRIAPHGHFRTLPRHGVRVFLSCGTQSAPVLAAHVGPPSLTSGSTSRFLAPHGHVRTLQRHCVRVFLRRTVDARQPGKGNSNSHGARPVHLFITMTKWIRTSRLSIKNSLFESSASTPQTPDSRHIATFAPSSVTRCVCSCEPGQGSSLNL